MKRDLEIGMEYPIKGEDTYIFKIARDLTHQLEVMYGPGETKRQAHPKMHAVLKAEFIVEPDLPEDLKVGVFKHEKSFPCWIRLSSSSTKIQIDKKKDVRGFAIKLFDVPGEKLITDQIGDDTQDFLLVSMPTFPMKNVKQFQQMLSIITSGQMSKLLSPKHWGSLAAAIRFKKSFIKASNLLQIPYWSTTPYQFGDKDRAVKYHIRPRSAHQDPMPKKPADWYLRDAIKRSLGQSEIWFDFMVQFQLDARKMPIENAKVKWKSPFTKVASIRIPQQEFTSLDQDIFGQVLDFSPWHSLPEHRPLGGMNRARRIIYHAMAAHRMKRDKIWTGPQRPDMKIGSPVPLTNVDRLNQVLEAYRDKDLKTLLTYMADDVVWNRPPDASIVPYCGTIHGKEAVLEMFKMQSEFVESEFLEPEVLGNPNESKIAIYGIEKVNVKADPDHSHSSRGEYQTAFLLIVQFNEESLISRVDTLYDTAQLAAFFTRKPSKK